MLALQYFKKSVVETVLGVLARTGRVDAVLYALRTDLRAQYDLMQFPLSVDQITTATQKGTSEAMEFAKQVMQDKELFISCMAVPQYLVRGYRQGRLVQMYRPFVYEESGTFTHEILAFERMADNHHVTVTPTLTLTYEYPVSTQPRTPKGYSFFYGEASQQPIEYDQVSGATFQVLFLKPHRLGVGYAFDSAMEVGTEYGHPITDVVGRGLRGIYVEQTRFAGVSPWDLTSHDALAVLEGSVQAIALPDVSRFPTPPMSKDPNKDYGDLDILQP